MTDPAQRMRNAILGEPTCRNCEHYIPYAIAETPWCKKFQDPPATIYAEPIKCHEHKHKLPSPR